MEYHRMIKRIHLFIVFAFLLTSCGSLSASKNLATDAEQINEQIEIERAFPTTQTELRYATAFTVEYFDHYKVLTVVRPWRNADTTFTYILLQRGSAPPENTENARIIEIPVRSMASLATTHLPYLTELGDLNALIAVGNAQYINTPDIVSAIEDGNIQAVGNGPDVNIEKIIELNPQVITTFAMGKSTKDDYQLLTEKGFNTVIFSDYMEESPLARAEWIKFMALFFNQEAEAEKIFSGIEQRYLEMQAMTANITDRPLVLLGYEINGNWQMPGGKSYQAAYIQDAGGQYLWADDPTSGRIPMSFESVMASGMDADYWFNQSVRWQTDEDFLAADNRYTHILAFSNQQVYNNNARVNNTNGNDFNESGLVNPHIILADLISIMHPDLLPDHELVYYRHIFAEEAIVEK
jgi:iron complex transport system substrate-binding protein